MRQKFNNILITIFMMSTLGYASNTDGITNIYEFVGVQAGITDYDGVTAPTLGIKYGQQNTLWRTAISYNFAHYAHDDFHTILAQVDRGILTDLFEQYPFKPYLGFSLGIMQNDNSHHKENHDIGYLYGFNAGVNYVMNHELDLDVGYRYLRSSDLEYMNLSNGLAVSLHYYFE